MRHAAITFAHHLYEQRVPAGDYDAIFCSDMLNLAEFVGLAPAWVRTVPKIAYFHENQLTYPVRHADQRDYQYVLTNCTTALAADAVWFNSAWHRDSFLASLDEFLAGMPDHQPRWAADAIRAKSLVQHPPIEPVQPDKTKPPQSDHLHILWAARWEHDKNPDDFFAAIDILDQRSVPFRLSVIGEQFRDSPAVFEQASGRYADRIACWGYQDSRRDYERVLGEADVIVSTAIHEFYGITVLEAVSAGAYPVLPDRLSYPGLLGTVIPADTIGQFLYDGTVPGLANRLTELADRRRTRSLWPTHLSTDDIVRPYLWPQRLEELDAAVESVVHCG